MELAQRGVEVTLVTADDLDKNGKADRALIGQVRNVDEAGVERRARGAHYSLIVAGILFGVVALCGLALFLLGYPATVVAIAGFGGGFIVSVVFAFSVNYFKSMRVYSYVYYATLSRVRVFMSSKNDRTGASGGERLLVHAQSLCDRRRNSLRRLPKLLLHRVQPELRSLRRDQEPPPPCAASPKE